MTYDNINLKLLPERKLPMDIESRSSEQLIKEILDVGIIDAIGDAVSIQDTDFRVLFQNDKAINIIGDHKGEYCYKGFEGKAAVCEDCPLALTMKDGKARTVERRNPIRTELTVEITASAIKDPSGKIIAGMEVVRNISRRKQLEQLVIQAKNDWEETFDIIDDAITIHDKEFNIIRANKAAEKMLGIELSVLHGQKCFESYHGTYSPPGSCPSCQTLKTGKSTTTEIFEPYLNKYIEVKALPRYDKDDQLVGLVHVVKDITERRKMEEDQGRLVADLMEALTKVKTLKGLLPICASCNKIRDDEGNWNHVDVYIRDHSEAEITHGYCPDCALKHFPRKHPEED
jgi:PAS domain S-box-containing protein